MFVSEERGTLPIPVMMAADTGGLVEHQGIPPADVEESTMQHTQRPLMRLVSPPESSVSDREAAVMQEVADVIRDRASSLPPHSAVARELAYVATRLDLAARSPHPRAAAHRLGTG